MIYLSPKGGRGLDFDARGVDFEMGFFKCLVYKNINKVKSEHARNVDIRGFVKKCLVMHKIGLDGWGSMCNVTLKSD